MISAKQTASMAFGLCVYLLFGASIGFIRSIFDITGDEQSDLFDFVLVISDVFVIGLLCFLVLNAYRVARKQAPGLKGRSFLKVVAVALLCGWLGFGAVFYVPVAILTLMPAPYLIGGIVTFGIYAFGATIFLAQSFRTVLGAGVRNPGAGRLVGKDVVKSILRNGFHLLFVYPTFISFCLVALAEGSDSWFLREAGFIAGDRYWDWLAYSSLYPSWMAQSVVLLMLCYRACDELKRVAKGKANVLAEPTA